MTAGSKTIGLTSGAGTTLVNYGYGTKTWSGGDYPKSPKRYVLIDDSYDAIRIKVHRGRRVEYVKHILRFRRQRIRPPRRAVLQEHAYTMSLSTRDDRIIGSCQPGLPPPSSDWYYASSGSVGGHTGFLWTANDDLKLLANLREKVAGSSFNAGVALGEGKEALSMITNAATRIYRSIRAVKRLDPWAAASALVDGTPRSRLKHVSRKTRTWDRSAADLWLELQYGWLPLLKDAEDSALFLANQYGVPMQHTVSASRVLKGANAAGVATDSPTYKRWTSNNSVCVGKIKAIITEKDVPKLAGLQDPLSVAWELLPWSFVADWFIPIGSWLDARGLASSLTGTFVTTHFNKASAKGFTAIPQGIGWGGYDFSTAYRNAGDVGFTVIQLSRVVSSSLSTSVPFPAVKPLSQAASWKHCTNAVALLVSGDLFRSRG